MYAIEGGRGHAPVLSDGEREFLLVIETLVQVVDHARGELVDGIGAQDPELTRRACMRLCSIGLTLRDETLKLGRGAA